VCRLKSIARQGSPRLLALSCARRSSSQ
jgi:hypothetical protein